MNPDLPPNGSGSGSGSGVYCQVGTNTTVVDSEETCTSIGGKVVSKPQGGTTICGGCGISVANMAEQFGLSTWDIVTPSRTFLERAAKESPDGKKLLKQFGNADKRVVEAVRNNPAMIGDLTMALVAGAGFIQFVLLKPGGAYDKLKLPRLAERSFRRSIAGLRRGTSDKKFHEELDLLEAELKNWSRKTVAQIRTRFLRG